MHFDVSVCDHGYYPFVRTAMTCFVVVENNYVNDMGVNMGEKKCGTLDFRLRGRRLTRMYTQKNRCIFAPNGTMWSFHNQISINILVTRWRKHCWSAPRVFSYIFCS